MSNTVAKAMNDSEWQRLQFCIACVALAEITSQELRDLRELCDQELERRKEEDGDKR